MQCKGCGAELKSEVRYCPYCGREQEHQRAQADNDNGLPQIHIHTHYEGQQPQVRVAYSAQPQEKQPQIQIQYQQPGPPMPPVVQISPKSRTVALLLEIFFGVLGVHRFYMGHTAQGVLYLLTGGCCGIGCLADFFILLLGNPRDAYGREMRW